MQDKEATQGLLNQDAELDGSYDWREEENEKTIFKQPRIKDLFPVNYLAEKDRFFEAKTDYNPHFCYKMIVSPEVIALSCEHEELAVKILTNNKHNT